MGWASRANKVAQDVKAGAIAPKARISRAREPIQPERIARVTRAYGGGQAGGILASLALGIAATPPPPAPRRERKHRPSMGGQS